jgi:hypothetical protein
MAAAVAYSRERFAFHVRHETTGFAVLLRDDAILHVWAASDESWRTRDALGERPIASGAESFARTADALGDQLNLELDAVRADAVSARPVQLIELREIDSVARSPTGALHLPEMSERAHRRRDALVELDGQSVLGELHERWRARHPVQHVDFACECHDLHAHGPPERFAGEGAADRVLCSQPVEGLRELVHVGGVRLRDEVEVPRRSHDPVRADRESADHDVADLSVVEHFDDALRLEALLGAHRRRPFANRSVARLTSIVRRSRSAGDSLRCSLMRSASFQVVPRRFRAASVVRRCIRGIFAHSADAHVLGP